MFTVLETDVFRSWLANLRDRKARARVDARLARLRQGNLGDWKAFDGIGEMRIDYGPGYRVYFARRGQVVIVLLCGGDKRTQDADIKHAKRMLAQLKE
jgi:putative addiction module killer protein